MLNTTTKAKASAAACLTLLSYIATAVISANEAMHYAHNLWPGMQVFQATLALLGGFALLNIIGISESAIVAVVLFAFHMVTLTVLVASAGLQALRDPTLLWQNLRTPLPDGLGHALFFGFSSAMLGISGFESSANFIEEQAPGVFPKTLRNMWVAVAVFNPLISILGMVLLPISAIGAHKQDLLAHLGFLSGGSWLKTWVSVDATLVLSVLENEQSKRLMVVHCYEQRAHVPADLALQLSTLDRIYPELRIDFVLVKGRFGPPLIEKMSRRLGVAKTICSSALRAKVSCTNSRSLAEYDWLSDKPSRMTLGRVREASKASYCGGAAATGTGLGKGMIKTLRSD